MNTKTKVALIGLGVAVGIGITGAGYVNAATATDTDLPPIVNGLVENFNLNKAEVNAYLETEREERQTEREAEFTKALDEAVADEKLTEAQKKALLAKHDELQVKREALRGVTGPDKREKMQAFKAEMNTFLQNQNIDQDILPELGPNGNGARNGQGRGLHQTR